MMIPNVVLPKAIETGIALVLPLFEYMFSFFKVLTI